jgi:hypothetical protein
MYFLAFGIFKGVYYLFDWIDELIEGMGTAVGDAISSVWTDISGEIWTLFLRWIYEMIYSGIADFFTMISEMGTKLFELAWVKGALEFFSLFGWALFVAGLVVAVFEIAVEYQTQGRFNIKRQILPFIYGFMAVSLFTVVPIELYRFSVSLQNTFARDLTRVFAGSSLGLQELAVAALNSFNPSGSATLSLLSLIALIALGYCVIKVFFSNIQRGGILIIQIAVGSLYMFSIPRGYTDGFNQWCKQIIALCLTTFMQTTLLFLGLLTFQTDMLLGLGVMLAANEVPRIAQQFGLDTSVRVNMSSAVHSTTQAIKLTKSIIKR